MPKTLQETKILIIEDEPMLSDIACQSFSRAGFQVFPAFAGEEGIRIARIEDPDVILLDIIMPGMSGYDVLTHIKNDVQLKHIPVIVFSNLALEKDIEKAMKLGATDFLIKANCTLKDVIVRVRNLLGISP